MTGLVQDLRFGARVISRSPGLTVAAILALALGIGANTAIFTGVYAMMLRPLPYPEPDRLVVPATVFPRLNTDRGSVSYPDFLDWKANSRLFEAVAAYTPRYVEAAGGDYAERIQAAAVTGDFFRVFRTPPLLGRVISDEEQLAGAAPVAVLGYGFWKRRFGGDPKVIGSKVEISGAPWLIVGVMPREFAWPQDAELWIPLGFGSGPPAHAMRRDNHIWQAVARLRRDVGVGQAQAALSVEAERVAREAKNRAGTSWKLHPLNRWVLGPWLERTLLVLMGAVGFVLAIACANVANLLLARGASREAEMAVRTALGAGRKRIVRQLLTESALLAAAGAAAGLVVAWWCVKGIVRFAPAGLPRMDNVKLDSAALAFTIAVSALTALVFGLAPALHAAGADPADSLREAGRRASGLRGSRARQALVVAEIALSVILLCGAGLLVRSFFQLQRVNPGFPTHNLLTMEISLQPSRYQGGPRVWSAFDEIAEAARRVPGVSSAAAVSALPLGGGGFYLGRVFLKEGQPEPPAGEDVQAQWNVIQPGYFRTMGIPIVEGRDFTARDEEAATPAIIVSRSVAKRMFPDGNVLGKRIRSWRDENRYREIVGVAGDVLPFSLTGESTNLVYVPHRQDIWRSMVLTVRTDGDPAALAPAIQAAIHAVDAKLAIAEVETMADVIDAGMAPARFSMMLLAAFAAAALVLAAVGIYGVMAYSVARRTRELGIRIALGADSRRVLGEVFGQATALVAIGLALGLAGAAGLTRLMSSLIFGVRPGDPATMAGVAALLAAVALAACYAPARRALRVDPAAALRQE